MIALASSAQAFDLRQPVGWRGSNSGTPPPSAPVNITPCSVALAPGTTGLVGEQVNITPGIWDDGSASLSYQLQRNGVNIPGATGTTYTLTEADASQPLTCIETAANGGGSEFQASSNDVTPLALHVPVAPGMIYAPSYDADFNRVGVTTPISWVDANPPTITALAYEWQESTDDASWFTMSGETSSSTAPGSVVSGRYYRVCTIATNAAGNSDPAYSPSVQVP